MPKGERRVRDPTTGGEIIVKDADPKGESTAGEFCSRSRRFHGLSPACMPRGRCTPSSSWSLR